MLIQRFQKDFRRNIYKKCHPLNFAGYTRKMK